MTEGNGIKHVCITDGAYCPACRSMNTTQTDEGETTCGGFIGPHDTNRVTFGWRCEDCHTTWAQTVGWSCSCGWTSGINEPPRMVVTPMKRGRW